jgi:hypothetical protein
MVAVPKFSDAKVVALMHKHGGIRSLVATEMGCTRQNLCQRIKNSEKLREVEAEIGDEVMDLVEGTIIKAIKKGDLPTTRWYADRQGKARGFGNTAQNRMSDADIEAFVAAFGEDLEKLRAFRSALSERPG